MATAAATTTLNRCKRCGTIMRNARKICPCCSFDPAAPVVVAAAPVEEPAQKKPRLAAAKAGVKLCPVCMASVVEAEMVEVQGKRVCAACAERLNKTPGAGAPAAQPAPEANAPAARVPAGSPDPSTPIAAAAAATQNVRSFAHEEERLKKKLLWPKIILILFGIVFIVFGLIAYAGGGLAGMVNEKISSTEFESNMSDKGPDGKKLTEEQKAERQRRIDEAKEQLAKAEWSAKLGGIVLAALGVFFFATFFMVNKYPFEACLIALIFFVLDKVWGFVEYGMPGIISILIMVSILSSLVKGVVAGQQLKKLREEKAASGR